jgi:S1-C subfamily serine protease
MRDINCQSALVDLASIVLAVIATSNVACADYTFRPDPALRTRSLTATVRIFAAETGGEQLGSGFVIDSSDGLILTAAHVVAELKDAAWVAFPRETTRHSVKTLMRKLTSKSTGAENSPAIDLAVLKLDPKVDNVDSLEVQFEPINTEQEHEITGYGRSNSEPQEAVAKPSYSDNCLYTLRSETLYGDSGSAVLTAEGLVDGIAMDGAESGGGASMSQMKVLPLSCVKPQILDLVPDSQSNNIMATIAKGNDFELRHAFQPPPRSGWVSNLRLAKAVQGWIAGHKSQKQPIDDGHLKTAFEIIVQRRLGYEIVVALSHTNTASEKDAGDALQNFAHAELGRGSTANAKTAYAEARTLYLQYASEHLPDTNNGAVAESSDVAAAYKSVADTLVAGALISETKENDLNNATSFAAAAVRYAPQGELKASAWATLGTASQEAGDVSVAVPAYKAALDEGASASWIAKDLLKAKSALGQQPQAKLTAEYLDNGARAALAYIAASPPEAKSSVTKTLTELRQEFADAAGKIEVECTLTNNELEKSEGTVFVLTKDGYALTTARLFGDETCLKTKIAVRMRSPFATPRLAELVNLDRELDLALIKLAEGSYTPAKLSPGTMKSGEAIATFGFPLNQAFASAGGIVVTVNGPGGRAIVDVDLYPDFSGSPVFDRQGRVAGIATGNISRPSGAVVPIGLAKRFVERAGIQLP